MCEGVATVLPASTVFRDQIDEEGCKDMGRELGGALLSLPGAPTEKFNIQRGSCFK